MSRRGTHNQAFSLFSFQDIIMSVTGIMILITLILSLELLVKLEASPAQQTQQVVKDIAATLTDVAELEQTVAQNQARIEDLRRQLSEGNAEISELARFDQRGVQRDFDNMQRMNPLLASELAKLDERIRQKAQQREEIEQQHEAIDAETLKQMLEDVQEKEKDLEELKNRVIFNPTEGDAKTPWLVEIAADGITVAETGVSAPPTKHATANELEAWALQNRDKNGDYFVLLVKPDGIATFERVRRSLQQLGFEMGYDLLQADMVAIDPETGAAAQ